MTTRTTIRPIASDPPDIIVLSSDSEGDVPLRSTATKKPAKKKFKSASKAQPINWDDVLEIPSSDDDRRLPTAIREDASTSTSVKQMQARIDFLTIVRSFVYTAVFYFVYLQAGKSQIEAEARGVRSGKCHFKGRVFKEEKDCGKPKIYCCILSLTYSKQ
jgi:hypothetical protein